MINRRPLITAGLLLGIGLGGFIDGILLHQVFQLHSMLSARLPQDSLVYVKASMVGDGLFHLCTWFVTIVGLAVLWQAGKHRNCHWSGKTLWGGLVAGWGIFNLVEGIIDHHILQVHHVVERLGLSIYDYLFLASGGIFTGLGLLLIISGKIERIGTSPSPAHRSLWLTQKKQRFRKCRRPL